MQKLTKEELFAIKGGSISGTMVNAITKMLTTIYDLGRSIGSTIRRLIDNDFCS